MYDRIYRRKPPSDSLRTSLRRITSSLSFAREDRSWSVFLFALLSPCRGLLILARLADVSIARSRRLIFRFRIPCVGFLGLWGVSFVYKRLTNKKRETRYYTRHSSAIDCARESISEKEEEEEDSSSRTRKWIDGVSANSCRVSVSAYSFDARWTTSRIHTHIHTACTHDTAINYYYYYYSTLLLLLLL